MRSVKLLLSIGVFALLSLTSVEVFSARSCPAVFEATRFQQLKSYLTRARQIGNANPAAQKDSTTADVRADKTLDAELANLTQADADQFLSTVQVVQLNEAIRTVPGITLERVQNFMMLFMRGNLIQLRDTSLRANLEQHGFKSPANRSAREQLKSLSSENRARLAKVYKSSPSMKEAELIVNDLRLSFTHNSVSHLGHDVARHVPILASRFLKDLTGFGGLNSQYHFNREFMKNDDNVYFIPRFLGSQHDDKIPSSYYGEHGFTLNPDYAREVGWISSFVMYPSQLQEALPRSYRTATGLRKQLHKTDFTVSDFETLVKENLLSALAKLQKENPQRHARAIQDLQERDKIGGVLSDLVYHPLGIGSKWELKVPVLVPQSQIQPF